MNKKTVQEIFDLSLINLRKNRPLSSTKDIILVESLKSDGIKVRKNMMVYMI